MGIKKLICQKVYTFMIRYFLGSLTSCHSCDSLKMSGLFSNGELFVNNRKIQYYK